MPFLLDIVTGSWVDYSRNQKIGLPPEHRCEFAPALGWLECLCVFVCWEIFFKWPCLSKLNCLIKEQKEQLVNSDILIKISEYNNYPFLEACILYIRARQFFWFYRWIWMYFFATIIIFLVYVLNQGITLFYTNISKHFK